MILAILAESCAAPCSRKRPCGWLEIFLRVRNHTCICTAGVHGADGVRLSMPLLMHWTT